MLRIAAAIAALSVGVTVAYAQNLDVIKNRRGVMKTVAGVSSAEFKMMKGEVPFDLAKVQAGLKTFQDEVAKFKGLFPDDAKTGGDTDASPKIWQARADFDAAADNFINLAKAAATTITDEASFKANYTKVAEACGACHKETDGFSPRLGVSFKKLTQ